MKLLLTFLFNTFRNACVVIVFGLIGIIVYAGLNGAYAHPISLSSFQTKSSNNTDVQEEEEEEEFGVMSMTNQHGYHANRSVRHKRLKVNVEKGFAYIQPSDISTIEYNDKISLIKTVNNQQIESKDPLKSIYESLEKSMTNSFVKGKYAIINCDYVMKISKIPANYQGKYSSKVRITMENGDSIQFSKERGKELEKALEQFLL